LWDSQKQQPNYVEYQRLEKILEELSTRKIMVFPFAGFLGRDSNFPKDDENARKFLEYTISRIGSYWNILYNVGGPEPLLRGRPYLTNDQVNYWGRFIDSLNVYGHLLSCHNETGNDHFKDEPWTHYGVLQGPKTTDRMRLNKGLLDNLHPQKPLYAQETLWSGNMYHPKYSMTDMRKNAFAILMSAAMINYADNDGNSSSGFSGTLYLEQANLEIHREINRIWDFFEKLPYYKTRPSQELVNTGICLAEPGEFYLVYLPDGGNVEVALTESDYMAWWINPRDTYDSKAIGDFSGHAAFSAPDTEDWLLLISRLKDAKLPVKLAYGK
jgi:hypothetical protein